MKRLTKIIGTIALMAGLTFGQGNSASIQNIYNTETEKNTIELNWKYNIMDKLSANGFIDLKEDGGYVTKTKLTTPIAKGVAARTETVQANEMHTSTGIGLNYTVPGLPEGYTISVSALPIHIDEGKVMKNEEEQMKKSLDYYLSAPMPFGIKLYGFGVVDATDPEDMKWGYGRLVIERDFEIPIGTVNIAGLAELVRDLESKDQLVPKATPAIRIQYKF